LRIPLIHSEPEAIVLMIYGLAALEPANYIVAVVVQEWGLIPLSVPLSFVHIHEGLNILDVEMEVVVFLLRVDHVQVNFKDLPSTINEESPSLLERDLRLYMISKLRRLLRYRICRSAQPCKS
jgi:hypothetical protein